MYVKEKNYYISMNELRVQLNEQERINNDVVIRLDRQKDKILEQNEAITLLAERLMDLEKHLDLEYAHKDAVNYYKRRDKI